MFALSAQNTVYHSIVDAELTWSTSNRAAKGSYWSNELQFKGRDTTINQKQYKILNRSKHLLGVDRTSSYYLREDSDKRVYLYQGGEDQLLYDFEAVIGDSLWRKANTNSQNIYYYVHDIDYVNINGSSRKRLHIFSNWVSNDSETEWYWIEGIGNAKYGILSFNAPDIGYAYTFCSVSKSGEIIFPENGSICYSEWFTIEPEKIKFVPNPSSNFVSLSTIEGVDFKLYDAFGRLRLTKPVGEKKLDITSLENGIYFTS